MALRQLRINKQITVRENQSIEKYLQQVQGIPLPTIEQEIEYTRAIKQGIFAKEKLDRKKKQVYREERASKKSKDPASIQKVKKAFKSLRALEKKTKVILAKAREAQEKLVLGNLRFVISVAKQYQNRGLSINDLINEGNIGLIKASVRFDETRGFKFISYAVWWIRQCILQATQEKGRSIRIPGSLTSLQQKVYKVSKRLVKELEREPTPLEIAEEVDMSVKTVIAIRESNIRSLSIDAPFKQGEENTLLDVLENEDAALPEENLMNEALREDLERAINQLEKREQKVIREYFGLGQKGGFAKTLEDIAKDLSITRERARQLKERALLTLYDYLTNESKGTTQQTIKKKGKPSHRGIHSDILIQTH